MVNQRDPQLEALAGYLDSSACDGREPWMSSINCTRLTVPERIHSIGWRTVSVAFSERL